LKFRGATFVANRKQNSAQLAALVQRYDPQGDSENVSLRIASAWVSWDAAMQENGSPAAIVGRRRVAAPLSLRYRKHGLRLIRMPSTVWHSFRPATRMSGSLLDADWPARPRDHE